MNLKIKPLDIFYYYLMFLFLLPNDVFYNTPIYIFDTPATIRYNLYKIPLSYLYLPVIVIGIYIYLTKRRYMYSKVIGFIVLLFIKDIFMAVYWDEYLFANKSYEMYVQFLFSAFAVAIIFYKNKSLKEIYKFFEIFMIINVLGLLVSVVTGIGTGLYGFEKRYHAANLSHGETAYLLGLFTMYVIFVKELKYKYVYIIALFMLILATGSRKDFLYSLFFFGLYSFIYLVRFIKSKKMKIKILNFIMYFFIGMVGAVVLVLFSNYLLNTLDFERTFSIFLKIKDFGLKEALTSDYSGGGRIQSVIAGFKIIKDNPLGLSFSFFHSQYMMNYYGYPTFAHISVVFYYITMGILVVIPIYMYLATYLKLLILKHQFRYVFLYFILYNVISGGALLNIKTLVINIAVLWIGIKIVKENKDISRGDTSYA